MNSLTTGFCAAALSLLCTSVCADGSNALYVRSLAASCAACHGTEGQASKGSIVPGLVGVPALQFKAQMKAFKDATRGPVVMVQISRGFDDAQIAQLADYFAGQKKE